MKVYIQSGYGHHLFNYVDVFGRDFASSNLGSMLTVAVKFGTLIELTYDRPISFDENFHFHLFGEAILICGRFHLAIGTHVSFDALRLPIESYNSLVELRGKEDVYMQRGR